MRPLINFLRLLFQHLERPSPLITIKNLVNKKSRLYVAIYKFLPMRCWHVVAREKLFICSICWCHQFFMQHQARSERKTLWEVYFFQHARLYNGDEAAAVPDACYLFVAQANRKSTPFLNVWHTHWAISPHSKSITRNIWSFSHWKMRDYGILWHCQFFGWILQTSVRIDAHLIWQ